MPKFYISIIFFHIFNLNIFIIHFTISRIKRPSSDAPDFKFSIPCLNLPSQSRSEVSVPRATDHENAYNFGHKRRGLCVIINNVEFDPELKLAVRLGSDADETGLVERFRNLEFEVRNYRNAGTRDMLKYLRDGMIHMVH